MLAMVLLFALFANGCASKKDSNASKTPQNTIVNKEIQENLAEVEVKHGGDNRAYFFGAIEARAALFSDMHYTFTENLPEKLAGQPWVR